MVDAADRHWCAPLDPGEPPPRGILPEVRAEPAIPASRLAPVAALGGVPAAPAATPADLLPAWADAGGEDAPLSAAALDGSWYLRLAPEDGGAPLHGVLRIEARPAFGLMASADLYLAPAAPAAPPRGQAARFGGLWYPHLPAAPGRWEADYAAYLRGTAAALDAEGGLRLGFVRHGWDAARCDFGRGEPGAWMALRGTRRLFAHPEGGAAAPKLHGRARLGGAMHLASACKTSPYQRGCYVVAEEMAGTRWPAGARLGGRPVTFTGVFRDHGMDIRGHVAPGKRPAVNPLAAEDAFRALNRAPFESVPADTWRMRLVVGLTGETPPGRRVLGVMRDDEDPYRETAVGFYAESLPDALGVPPERLAPGLRAGPLGATPAAFLRTLLHEAGHVFSLQHAADLAGVPRGRTLMEPTSAVIAAAPAGAPPYPEDAEFRFSDHDVTVLLHAPDVQVAPGRMPYNWLPGLLHGGVLPWREARAWRSRG